MLLRDSSFICLLLWCVCVICMGHSLRTWSASYRVARSAVCDVGCLDSLHRMIVSGSQIGCTPAYAACQNGHVAVVEYLKQAGCNLETPAKVRCLRMHVTLTVWHGDACMYCMALSSLLYCMLRRLVSVFECFCMTLLLRVMVAGVRDAAECTKLQWLFVCLYLYWFD